MNLVTITGASEINAPFSRIEIADFLFESLEKYGDARPDILKCLAYALDDNPAKGGFIVLAVEHARIVGAVVVNRTGMSGYIPENLLVYIAVDASQRGLGTGQKLMRRAIADSDGDIALHVDQENPAIRLYERLGFKAKYVEMRMYKSDCIAMDYGDDK